MASIRWMSKYAIITKAVKCNDRIFPVSAQEVFTVKFLQPCYSKFSIIKFWENINKAAMVPSADPLRKPNARSCWMYYIFHSLPETKMWIPKDMRGAELFTST